MDSENNLIKEAMCSADNVRKHSITAVFILLAAFLLVLTISSFIKLGDDTVGYNNMITVTGEGEVIAIPDIATVSFSVQESSESVDSAQKMATEKINKVSDLLKENGIEEKDIKTQSYNISPRYEWVSNCPSSPERNCGGNSVIVGYQVFQSTVVKIRETEKAGEILSLLGSAEVAYVNGLQFSIDDTEALREEARAIAIDNAKAKAKKLAKQLDVDLEDIVSFSEDGDNLYGPQYDQMYSGESDMMQVAKSSAPQLSVGEDKITSRVYVTFSLDN